MHKKNCSINKICRSRRYLISPQYYVVVYGFVMQIIIKIRNKKSIKESDFNVFPALPRKDEMLNENSYEKYIRKFLQ